MSSAQFKMFQSPEKPLDWMAQKRLELRMKTKRGSVASEAKQSISSLGGSMAADSPNQEVRVPPSGEGEPQRQHSYQPELLKT